MSNKVRIIANYLPQYHETIENNNWWGKGYTDWVAVKNSTSLFENHNQPKKPLNNNYYDLSVKDDIKWQAELARKYNIDAFGIYHYWFSSEQNLLSKPAEIIKQNKDIDIDYLFIWDNSTWKRTWSNVKEKFSNDMAPMFDSDKNEKNKGILANLEYGNEKDWKRHFEYLLDFFNDERYIKEDNCPVFVFYNQDNKPEILKEMCACWNKWAKENGFNGMYFIGKKNTHNVKIAEHEFLYQPLWDAWIPQTFIQKVSNKLKEKCFSSNTKLQIYDYDKVWNKIFKSAKKWKNESIYYGAFVSYDDTPRRGNKGKVIVGSTPEKFGNYILKLVDLSKKYNKKFIFVTAWNEWGEGAYLEPDITNKYGYLEQFLKINKEELR